MRARYRLLALLPALLLPASAQASYGTGIDAQENVFGATNVNAVAGHGGLTVGVSREGDVTVLSWPGPSYSDQLAYQSSNALDARAKPRFGAPEGAGLFVGLRYELAGNQTGVTWLRDRATWTVSQDYGPDDGGHPHTYFTSAALGLKVTIIDAVATEADLLAREVRIERLEASPVEGLWLLSYANLSPLPTTSRIPELPIADWIMDGRNDFAAVWDRTHDSVIHFHPDDRRVHRAIADVLGNKPADFGSVGLALKASAVDDNTAAGLVAGLDTEYGPGAYAVMTTRPPPDQHQIGFDATPFCAHIDETFANLEKLPSTFPGFKLPLDSTTLGALRCKTTPQDLIAGQGWTASAADPWTDAQDGELSGSHAAAGEVAEALRTPVTLDASGHATVHLLVGFGKSAAEALGTTSLDPAAAIARSNEALESWLEGRDLPGAGDRLVRQVARRALVALRTGTDKGGAIVASIARQPPYALDWPRDGAFFNVLLDATGQSALVDERVRLYEAWQRRSPTPPTIFVDPPAPVDPATGEPSYPADAWEMNYFADGLVGGTIRFEIDTTAFAVFSIVAHSGWVDDPAAYLSQHWETIESGTNLLARWRDPATGLHAPAQEDDAAKHAQTLHGAITVFGALDIAARAARLLGKGDVASRWETRGRELREAIRAKFYDPERGVFFMTESDRLPIQASGLTPVGPTGWLVWPCTLYPFDDDHIRRQLARDYDVIRPALDLTGKGGLYYMQNTLAFALAAPPEMRPEIDRIPGLLAAQATPDTHHFGEVMIVVDEGGARRAEQRVSLPHLWEGALFVLTALAAEDPSRILRYDSVLPRSKILFERPPSTGDSCGCRVEAHGADRAMTIAGLSLVPLVAALLRRRRSAPRS